MHRNTFTTERRFSLNTTSPHLTNPIAESTCINGTPMRPPLFNGLSPKQRSSSIPCLSPPKSSTTPKTKADQSLLRQMSSHSISRQKLNLSQIDPTIYADINSSGLASRVVKYHDGNGRNLHRSLSARNLYNRPVQSSPSQKLHSPLPYKTSIPKVPMTRIAPPERSFYCGNTLPSLLRSNSMIGLPKTCEELSRENRPIMHPPPQESEPTRSVLDALKEISRKRINTNDLQHQEQSKKSCNRAIDFADGLDRTSQQQPLMHHHPPHHLYHIAQPSSFKRQRELSVTVPLHPKYSQAQQQPLQSVYSASSPQKSPEQLAKRRNCSYNNDIASSLSSSRLHTHKRKLYDIRARVNNTISNGYASNATDMANDSTASVTSSSGSNSPENSLSDRHAAKIQRKQTTADLRLEQLGKSLSCHTPITPLPETPYTQEQTTAAAPAHRSISEPSQDPSKAQQTAETRPKPKLTLFNAQQRQHGVQAQQEPQKDLKSPDVESGEYSGIQFVKPKQQNSMSGSKNLSIERTHKTKLALMLSSLRGEIYQGEPLADEFDGANSSMTSPPTAPVTLSSPIKPILGKSTEQTSAATTEQTVKTTTTSALPTKPVILNVVTSSPPADKSAASTNTTSTTTTQPMFTFKTPPNPAAKSKNEEPNPSTSGSGGILSFKLGSSTEIATTTSVAAEAADTANKSASLTTTTGTIMSFINPVTATTKSTTVTQENNISTTTSAQSEENSGQTTSTSLSSMVPGIQTAAPAAAPKPLFAFGQTSVATFGAAATSSATTTTTATTSTTLPKSTFTFGNPSTSTTPTTAAAAPGFGGGTAVFSFGKPAAQTTTAAAATTATTTITSLGASTFSFGKPTTTTETMAPAPTTAPVFGSQPTSTFNFKSPTVTTSAAAATTESKPAFGFVSSTNVGFGTPNTTTTTTTMPTATPTTFGSGSFKTLPEPAKTFNFNAPPNATTVAAAAPSSTTAAATSSNSNLFSFGNSAKTETTTAQATPSIFSFGQTPATTTTATPFAFGTPAVGDSKNNGSSGTPAAFSFSSGATSSTNTDNNKPSGTQAAFAFGSVGEVGKDNKAPFSFGSAATASKTSVDGNDNKSHFAFGSAVPSNLTSVDNKDNKSPFAFGSGTNSANNKPAFAFGTGSTTSGTTSVDSAAKPSNNIFSFGGATTSSTATNSNGNNQANPSLFGATTSSTATNSNGNNQANPSLFGATSINNNASNNNNTSNSSPFSFGGVQKPTPIFGAATAQEPAKPFSFGGTAATTQSNIQSQPNTNGFSFAAVAKSQSNADPSSGTNIFGSTSATAAVKPGFNFGSPATPGNVTNAAPSQSFGSFSAAASASDPKNKPFAFGAAASNAATPAPPGGIGGSLFSSALAAAQNQPETRRGGFSFGNKSATVGAAAPSSNSNAPFAFGGAASNASSAPTQGGIGTKPFNFGASSQAPAPSTPAMGNGVPHIFGSGATPSAASGAAFTFGGLAQGGAPAASQPVPGTPQQMGGGAINGNNLFAPPPTTPENRPFRRATRRLQK
ncbi:nuclear pore complex protein DDB_G0274915 isoform X2 [Scaptodrosophila lebanonensis]|uniref:Nuclear pore complex protein DDB_G0274915 isoform X2 n=1 Tax=Drosophila lebanonensis TaxID=7225 RepID=A0A6J2TFE4_DROLE|nr:nuclear pore complex protein DDB_G0274915 isoform X2 [Scaptodrosophila lebanonensis]